MKKLTILFLLFSIFSFAQKSVLKKEISNITSGKNATVAVSVKGIDFPFNYNNENASKHLPMQSVFKFHIAAAVLDFVDKGKLKLNQDIFIKKSDLLENTHSPLRNKYPTGNVNLPLSEIIRLTVAQSDNNGCDILLRLIGGTKTVQDFMNSKGVKDFQIKFNEEEMHKDWDVQYDNYTTTKSANQLLKKFFEGKILSENSTKYLMNVMLGTTTGTNKIVEQLPKETPVAHKTGASGRNQDGLVTAENDIAIITLPSGKHYALSVFVSNSSESNEMNTKMISDISKTVWDFFNMKKQ